MLWGLNVEADSSAACSSMRPSSLRDVHGSSKAAAGHYRSIHGAARSTGTARSVSKNTSGCSADVHERGETKRKRRGAIGGVWVTSSKP